jgi:exosome complex RNA-binding protein Rrp4
MGAGVGLDAVIGGVKEVGSREWAVSIARMAVS